MKSNAYFQIRNMPTHVRKAIKVAAAMEGLSMENWIIKSALAQLKRQGVIMEEDPDGEEEV